MKLYVILICMDVTIYIVVNFHGSVKADTNPLIIDCQLLYNSRKMSIFVALFCKRKCDGKLSD